MIHRIRRAVLELGLPQEATAFRRRQQVQELLYRSILPVLEEAFDRLAPDDRVLRIDRLEIDLGRLDPGALDERLLREAILAQVSRQLRALPPADRAPAARLLTLEETLAAFLEIGAWPWQAVIRSVEELEAALAALPEARLTAWREGCCRSSGVAACGSAWPTSSAPDFVRWLVAQLLPHRAEELERIVARVGDDLGPVLRLAVTLAAAVNLAGEDGASAMTLARWMAEERRRLEPIEPGGRHRPEPSLSELLEFPPPPPAAPARRADEADPSALYVSCAGWSCSTRSSSASSGTWDWRPATRRSPRSRTACGPCISSITWRPATRRPTSTTRRC